MKRVVFLSLIFFSLAAVGQKVEKKQIDLKAEEQTIRSISMKWLKLQNNHDAAGVAALFADDGVSYKMNQEPAIGSVAIQKQYTKLQEQNPKEIDNWSTEKVEIAALGDMAIEYGKWNSTNLGIGGTNEDHGKYVTVYRKVNGTWKVIADIGNSTKPVDTSK